MPRLLIHAAALLCAVAVALVCYLLTSPTPVQLVGEVLALAFLALGLCLGRLDRRCLIACLLAAVGLLSMAFCAPADAATPTHKVLGVIEAPAAPLSLAAPTPQQVVVSVAQPDPAPASVALPISQWLSLAQSTIATILMGLLGAVMAKLPKPVVWAVKMYGEDKIVQQAIALAINAVPGASKGEPLKVDVGSSVLAHALQWVVDNVPKFAVGAMGGEDAIKAKLFAALHLEPDASAAAMGVKATA